MFYESHQWKSLYLSAVLLSYFRFKKIFTISILLEKAIKMHINICHKHVPWWNVPVFVAHAPYSSYMLHLKEEISYCCSSYEKNNTQMSPWTSSLLLLFVSYPALRFPPEGRVSQFHQSPPAAKWRHLVCLWNKRLQSLLSNLQGRVAEKNLSQWQTCFIRSACRL